MIETPRLVFWPVVPELVLCATGIVGMLYEAFARRSRASVHAGVAMAGLVAALLTALRLWDWSGDATALANSVFADQLSVLARVILLVVALFGVVYGTLFFRRQPEAYRGEFYPLVLFATAGMTLIVAAADLIVMFLALEILSLSLYVLTGITGRRGSNEAAMKYFLLGAFSSAFFLYGVAMAYGATQSTKLAEIATALAGRTGSMALALLAMAFLIVGFAFKVSAVPFHMWTPDVYQGAPNPVTAFMAAATKVAAFFALMRVLDVALQPLSWDWTPVVWVLAALSIVVGSVLAIAQTDVKRMLAYSSIAHAGFILTGLSAPGAAGIRAAAFYLIAYATMTLGAFGVVMLVAAKGEASTSLGSYQGLYKRSPALAALMSIFLLSLAGIPPTAGFVAKVTVFSAATGAGHWELALVGVIASVAAAFFYLRVIVFMFMREPQGESQHDESVLPRLVVALPAALTLVLGVFPGIVAGILDKAAVLRW